MTERVCAATGCTNEFTPAVKYPKQRYCSKLCGDRAWKAGYKARYGVNYGTEWSRDNRRADG